MTKDKSQNRDENLFHESSVVDAEQVSLTDDITSNGEKTMFDFTALTSEENTQAVKDYTAYQDLLRSIVNDECTLSKQEVLRIIERADADVTQLEADVAWRRERDKMIAEIHRIEEYRTKRDALTDTLKKMTADFKRYEEEYEAKFYPIQRERNQLGGKVKTATGYRNTLAESCRDVKLKLEYETLCDSWDNRLESNLHERQCRIQSELADAKSGYERSNKTLTIDRDGKKRLYKERIKELEAESQAIELKKIEVAQQKAGYETALEKLREAMIFA
jgi:predicted DNA-binding protein YlxM (UPF0122 family)